jgi:hypothetical protein
MPQLFIAIGNVVIGLAAAVGAGGLLGGASAFSIGAAVFGAGLSIGGPCGGNIITRSDES